MKSATAPNRSLSQILARAPDIIMARGSAVTMFGVRHSQTNNPSAKRKADTDKIIGMA